MKWDIAKFLRGAPGSKEIPQKKLEQLRLSHINLELVEGVLVSIEDFLKKIEEDERYARHKVPQTSYSIASDNYMAVACYKYALGEPLEEVHSYLVKAATYMGRVFELRGTAPPFSVTVVTLDPKGQVVDRRPLHKEGEVDYSTTNPVAGLTGLYLALIIGDMQLAQHVAGLIGDPENASYIGTDSEVCTPDEQHLAYGYQAFGSAGCPSGIGRIGGH